MDHFLEVVVLVAVLDHEREQKEDLEGPLVGLGMEQACSSWILCSDKMAEKQY